MGEAFQLWFVWNFHSGLPVIASAAIKAPPSSPKITRPVAVESVPPHEFAEPRCGSSHAHAPVLMSMARRIRSGFGSGAVRCDPPRYDLPDSQSPWSRLV